VLPIPHLNMVRYQHTQVSRWILAAAVPAMLVGVALAFRDSLVAGLLVCLMAALVLTSVFSLTTTVSDQELHVRFGIGLIRRRIPLTRIVKAVAVRNRWYYGWGMRLTPRGWLWNVWGLGAVELTYVDGRHFRIGSDEPERLAAEIQRGIERS
jgi:hypothetical protein